MIDTVLKELILDFPFDIDFLKHINITIKHFNYKSQKEAYCLTKNPILGLEVWQTEDSMLIKHKDFCIERKELSSTIFFHGTLNENTEIGYGVIRGEATRLIRIEKLRKAYFMLHAAFLRYKNNNYLLIGNKGTGKSCATLHFLKKGAMIFTDETVVFKEKKLDFIQRSLALDSYTLNKYYPDLSSLIWRKQKSIINTQTKNLLNINLTNSNKIVDYSISHVFVLTKGNTHLTNAKVQELIAKQFITGNLRMNNEAIKTVENLLRKVIVTNIMQIEGGNYD